MNNRKRFYTHLVFASLIGLGSLSSCDSPAALTASFNSDTVPQSELRATITTPANPQAPRTIEITDSSVLSPALRDSADIKVIVDNSNTRTNVTRNTDGSLSFNLPGNIQLNSDGSLLVIFSASDAPSQPVRLLTGPALNLKTPAFNISPAPSVTQGTQLTLKANLVEPEKAADFDFNWSYAGSAAGPWQPINGDAASVTWDPAQVGSYFIRLEMIERKSRSRSGFVSPTPLVSVRDSDDIAIVDPESGSILQGQSLSLAVNLPELESQSDITYLWSYGQSLQGAFQPIAERGANIRWEPPRSGSYYLRIQASNADQNSIYTSSKPLVFVADSDEIIELNPASGNLVRGSEISLKAKLPQTAPNLTYQWFYGFSPQAAFTPINGEGEEVKWTPPLTGDFYLRVRTFDPDTEEIQTFTTSKTVVSVQDSDTLFGVSPNPATLLKGASVELRLNAENTGNINWSYAGSANGPFTPIERAGKEIIWTPPSAGSFYLRAETPDSSGTLSTYTSANALVFVSERPNPIKTDLGIAELELGSSVSISANLSGLDEQGLTYAWSYGTSPQGSFQNLQPIDDPTRKTVTWYPPQSGSYFIKVDVTNPRSQSTVSFTSQEPLVLVSESQPFFTSDPLPAKIVTDDNLRLKANFDSRGRNFNYGWAYSTSQAGPFTPIGGSNTPEILWDEDKTVGTYFIRLQAAAPGTNRAINFVSRHPLVFVSDSDSPGASFGVPASGSNTAGSGIPTGFGF